MDMIYGISNAVVSLLPKQSVVAEQVKEVMLSNAPGTNFVRLAGISGALAVGMAAIGAHVIHAKSKNTELKQVFDTGNSMHLLHSVALLTVPLTRRPNLTGYLLTTGMLLFSGTCYYHALTDDKRLRIFTPYGGMFLILGWIIIAA
ncbi:transmembrane protein 256 homolog [Octopus bimaculoides]|uniref:Transmembrane protein 256 homolog n=1 Tax=Octopus bimaculoides TaxID=37653 RepID=A0A0L8HBV5_OCTBM|nr:transmembrane protein 256 homolog [Octopus bimaculoides]|eukprot:XP_014773720.1 PREDICTED: transmembrane protein 256 homolog [Octopus bimaculoides]